eukprot:11518813-Alexandrium_andersonii.AAC.1
MPEAPLGGSEGVLALSRKSRVQRRWLSSRPCRTGFSMGFLGALIVRTMTGHQHDAFLVS